MASLLEKGMFSRYLKEDRSMQICGGKGFWAEDTKSTEVLKRDVSVLKGIANEKEMKKR